MTVGLTIMMLCLAVLFASCEQSPSAPSVVKEKARFFDREAPVWDLEVLGKKGDLAVVSLESVLRFPKGAPSASPFRWVPASPPTVLASDRLGRLYVGTEDGDLWLLPESGPPKRIYSKGTDAGAGIGTLACSADGSWLAFDGVSDQLRLRVLERKTGRISVAELEGDAIERLLFAPSGSHLFGSTSTLDKRLATVFCWDTRARRLVWTLVRKDAGPLSLASNGRSLVAGVDGAILKLDAANGKLLKSVPLGSRGPLEELAKSRAPRLMEPVGKSGYHFALTWQSSVMVRETDLKVFPIEFEPIPGSVVIDGSLRIFWTTEDRQAIYKGRVDLGRLR